MGRRLPGVFQTRPLYIGGHHPGWLFIIIRQPFRVGDRIQVGEHVGDVIDVRLFMFSVLEIGKWVDADQSTGRIIHIPNGKVFKDPLLNYTQGFEYIWNEISVTVTFESNWKRARDILEEMSPPSISRIQPSGSTTTVSKENPEQAVLPQTRSVDYRLTWFEVCRCR